MEEKPVCDRCGQVHRRCKAHNKEGNPCMRMPLVGVAVCPSHGGRAPQVQAKSNRAKAERKAEAQLAKLARLGARREGLTASQLLQEVVERAGSDLEYIAEQVGNDPETWANAYAEILDRAAKVAKAGVDAGLAERQTAVQEAQVSQVVAAFVRVLQRLEMTQEVQAAARVLLAEELRQIGQ